MPLTPKGLNALNKIKEFYPKEKFTAKKLSDACGEKIFAATLNGIVDNGYLIKLGGSPVEYQAIENLENLVLNNLSSTNLTNAKLNKAKKEKNDEFYTRYEDIEAEVIKYRKQFKNKIVYLPCDDPAEKKSEFWSFFIENFDAFELKKLIATHYDENGKAYKIWVEDDLNKDGYIDDDDALQEDLKGNGDFRSEECIDILKECDIVITNPPFSLIRELVKLIMSYDKQFLIIAPQNAFKYKEIFPYIVENKIWAGYHFNKTFDFIMDDNYELTKNGYIDEKGRKHGKVSAVCWMTNLPNTIRNEKIICTKTYSATAYPKFDNFDAINVNKVVNIPKDYNGIMGVPISFLGKYNPQQFEIIGEANHGSDNKYDFCKPIVNGKEIFPRILIKRIS